jgi:magnesium-transporting ATPase (P-type)
LWVPHLSLSLAVCVYVCFRGLNVKAEEGVREHEIKDRKELFGINKVEPEPQDPLWKLMLEALQDPTLIFLTVAAFISLFIGVSSFFPLFVVIFVFLTVAA